MSRAFAVEAAGLYLPICITGVLLAISLPSKRQRAGYFFALFWCLVFLPLANQCMVLLGFWSFESSSPRLGEMPISLWIGWSVLWGPAAAVFQRKLTTRFGPGRALGVSLAFWLLFDLIFMPLCVPVIVLHEFWLAGECAMIVFCLLPSLFLSECTILDIHVGKRSVLLAIAFLALCMLIIPAAAEGGSFDLIVRFIRRKPPVILVIAALSLLIASLPAMAAVKEFAVVGRGTPVPFDPPKRLVTSGVYSYCSNPMQLCIGVSIFLWGAWLGNSVLIFVAGISLIYSIGLAHWSENEEHTRKFGAAWRNYLSRVPRWRCRLIPAPMNFQKAIVYLDNECAICSELATWIRAGNPVNLQVMDANEYPGRYLSRIRYEDPDTGIVRDGVAAMGRVFQHIHLGWALLGWLLEFPGISKFAQLILDASGVGPREMRTDGIV